MTLGETRENRRRKFRPAPLNARVVLLRPPRVAWPGREEVGAGWRISRGRTLPVAIGAQRQAGSIGGIAAPRPPGSGDTASLDDTANSYTVTVAAGSTVGGSIVGPFIEIDADPSCIDRLSDAFHRWLADGRCHLPTDPGGPATSVTVEAGGSLFVPFLLFSVDVPQTLTIAGTGAGGHLELGTPDVGGIVASVSSLMTLDFANGSLTAPNTGVIQIDGARFFTDPIATQTITDVAWGDEFVIKGLDFTGDTVTLAGTALTVTVRQRRHRCSRWTTYRRSWATPALRLRPAT